MKEILGNTVVFVIVYILFMLPTYYLPYLGSNSFSLSVIGVAVGAGINPAFWPHLASLMALAFVAWFRGILIDKKWLTIFPVLATVFDMAPVLSSIPLVPTVMHLLAIILGVVGTPAVIAPVQANYKLPRRIQVDNYVSPQALDPPRTILLGISGPQQGRQFPVNKKVYRIGRVREIIWSSQKIIMSHVITPTFAMIKEVCGLPISILETAPFSMIRG